jgi:hypothetical protein
MGRRTAVISCKTFLAQDYILRFLLDEGNYRTDVERRVQSDATIEGSVISDFGFHEGDRVISAGNLNLTQSQLDTLRAMQEDRDNDYEFSDGVNVWEVVVRSLTPNARGNRYRTTIVMNVVEKVV